MEGWRTYIYKRTSQVKKERKRKEEKQKGRKKRKTLMMKDNVSCLLLLLLLLFFFFSFYLIMLSFSFTVHSELNCWESFCAQNGYPPTHGCKQKKPAACGKLPPPPPATDRDCNEINFIDFYHS